MLLIEERPVLGGRAVIVPGARGLAEGLVRNLRAIEVWRSSLVWGLLGRTLAVVRAGRPCIVNAEAIVQRAPAFGAHVARVRVDGDSGRVRVVDYAVAQDVGRAINPAAVRGQIHGGVAQGIGWALLERMIYDENGSLATGTFLDYALPRASDVPPIQVALVEVPAERGPFGAKGVGEPPVVPVAAAIANAIADVSGARVETLPIVPEAVVSALAQTRRA